ncbi:MAG: isochorismate synthase, partial [Flavobacteriaceae bacterium]|nr:chorismate-binding protein [Bacteroidia bacterium]NNL59820.1 isochorismate synthase [Flavobacteriaceae bacterium]
LRCMQIIGDEIFLYVGGGITKESIPNAEWEETVNKANTMKDVL